MVLIMINLETHHTIGLYFADGIVDMPADAVMQQLARVRKPISIKLYIGQKPFSKVYSSRDDVKYEYEMILDK